MDQQVNVGVYSGCKKLSKYIVDNRRQVSHCWRSKMQWVYAEGRTNPPGVEPEQKVSIWTQGFKIDQK